MAMSTSSIVLSPKPISITTQLVDNKEALPSPKLSHTKNPTTPVLTPIIPINPKTIPSQKPKDVTPIVLVAATPTPTFVTPANQEVVNTATSVISPAKASPLNNAVLPTPTTMAPATRVSVGVDVGTDGDLDGDPSDTVITVGEQEDEEEEEEGGRISSTLVTIKLVYSLIIAGGGIIRPPKGLRHLPSFLAMLYFCIMVLLLCLISLRSFLAVLLTFRQKPFVLAAARIVNLAVIVIVFVSTLLTLCLRFIPHPH